MKYKTFGRIHTILAIINLPGEMKKIVREEICCSLFRNGRQEFTYSSRMNMFEKPFAKEKRWEMFVEEYKNAERDNLLYVVFVDEEDYDMLISKYTDRVYGVAIDFDHELSFPAAHHFSSSHTPVRLARLITFHLNYDEFGVIQWKPNPGRVLEYIR